MRINPITNLNFKAIQINSSNIFSREQTDFAENILKTANLPQENYNDRSIVQMLEQDYDMDLFVEANKDKESINLYFSEKTYLNGEQNELTRLTPIGVYNDKYSHFDVAEIENSIIELEHGKGKNFIGNLATLAMAIGTLLIVAMSIFTIVKDKNATKTIDSINNKINMSTERLNKAQEGTIKYFDAIKK